MLMLCFCYIHIDLWMLILLIFLSQSKLRKRVLTEPCVSLNFTFKVTNNSSPQILQQHLDLVEVWSLAYLNWAADRRKDQKWKSQSKRTLGSSKRNCKTSRKRTLTWMKPESFVEKSPSGQTRPKQNIVVSFTESRGLQSNECCPYGQTWWKFTDVFRFLRCSWRWRNGICRLR